MLNQDVDLKLFFDPTGIDVDRSIDSFQSGIQINKDKMPDHEGFDIALIGLSEYRGSGNEKGNPGSSDEVRRQLYRLKKGFGNYQVIDLGNFRNGPRLEDTYLRLKEVCSYLMRRGIIPILFGGSHDNDLGQFLAYEESGKFISLISVDQQVDMAEDGAHVETHMNRIFKHRPNFLFNFSILAYQSYLTGQKYLELLDLLAFEAVRLGSIKENIKQIEPLIRNADMLSFDLSAIQSFYAPGARKSGVFGLTGEEACQICWYAGQNEKLSSIGIYNYDLDLDSKEQKTAFTISIMIWYFIEGFYHRKGDKNFFSNDYILYEVHLGGNPETIRFFKSKKSGKWWMEVPFREGNGVFDRNQMIACGYEDYEKAISGEVPDRWLNFFSRS